MKINKALIILLAAAVLFSCSSSPADSEADSVVEPAVNAAVTQSLPASGDENDLFSGAWYVSALLFDGVYQTLVETEINMEKGNNVWRINGNSGVNYFSGELQMGNGYVYVSDNFMITKMSGPYELMDFEDKFMEVLLDADSWSWNGNALQLYCANVNGMLEFTRR